MLGCGLIFATVGGCEIRPMRGNIFDRKMP
jgi:hypothetical protein